MEYTDRELQIIECALSIMQLNLRDCADNTDLTTQQHNKAVDDSAICNRLLTKFKRELANRNVPLDEDLDMDYIMFGGADVF